MDSSTRQRSPLDQVRTAAEDKLSQFFPNEDNSLIEERFLDLMRCPVDGTKLANADSELIIQLNQQIADGQLRDRLDQLVSEPIEDALITESGNRIYPIRGGIPTLIADEAIER